MEAVPCGKGMEGVEDALCESVEVVLCEIVEDIPCGGVTDDGVGIDIPVLV